MATAPLRIGFNVSFEQAIEAAKARGVVLPAVYYGELPEQARRIAFTVSLLTAVDQIQQVLDQLEQHIATGGTFTDFQKWGEQQNWKLPSGRLETVFRNAIQTAYQAGHWRQFNENAASRGFLMYDAINDSRVRPSHLAMDNVIRPIGDPFWDRHSPPCGHRCRCSLISLTREQAEARSRGRDAGLNKRITDDMQADDAGWGNRPDLKRDGILQELVDIKTGKIRNLAPKIAQVIERKRKEPEL